MAISHKRTRERFHLDVNAIDFGCQKTIARIESSAHVLYIRYLFTKRYSPAAIRRELKKLGLSSPHEEHLTAYFNSIIWPAVEKFGLKKIYGDYHAKLGKRANKQHDFSKHILNYRLDLGPELDLQTNFCEFIYYLNLDDLWMGEIYKFYGTASKFPVDEYGERILTGNCAGCNDITASIARIVQHPKRYLIDQLILEGADDTRIAEYAQKQLKLRFYAHDVRVYKKAFFNVRALTLEEKIKFLESEKNYFEEAVREMNSGRSKEYADFSPGEISAMLKAAIDRVREIDENLYVLNAKHHQAMTMMQMDKQRDTTDMLEDMMRSAYSRFQTLSDFHDRDSIQPMFTLTRMVCMISDKLDKANSGKRIGLDQHADNTLIQLAKSTLQEMQTPDGVMENTKDMDYSYDDVEGLDELSVSYQDEDSDEDAEEATDN